MGGFAGGTSRLARPPVVLPEPDLKPGAAGSWFTLEVGGEVHGPGSNSLVLQHGGALNEGDDPDEFIALHSDPHYIFVAGGVTLHATSDFGPTQAFVGWDGDAATTGGTIEGVLTIYDSSFAVLHTESAFNVGSVALPGHPFQDVINALSLSADFTMPGDGYVAVRLDNPTARTLTIQEGTHIVLAWSS